MANIEGVGRDGAATLLVQRGQGELCTPIFNTFAWLRHDSSMSPRFFSSLCFVFRVERRLDISLSRIEAILKKRTLRQIEWMTAEKALAGSAQRLT